LQDLVPATAVCHEGTETPANWPKKAKRPARPDSGSLSARIALSEGRLAFCMTGPDLFLGPVSARYTPLVSLCETELFALPPLRTPKAASADSNFDVKHKQKDCRWRTALHAKIDRKSPCLRSL
jgi:hypothetical protein